MLFLMFHSPGATVQTEVCVAVVDHTVEPVIARCSNGEAGRKLRVRIENKARPRRAKPSSKAWLRQADAALLAELTVGRFVTWGTFPKEANMGFGRGVILGVPIPIIIWRYSGTTKNDQGGLVTNIG